MKTIIYWFILLIIITCSCSTYRGTMLESKCAGDCTYHSFATGSAQVSYFLGMGGNSSESLLLEAKRNMFLAFPLNKDQFYDNLIVEYKTSQYVFFSKLKVIVSGDIVTQGSKAEDEVYTENYTQFLSSGKTSSIDHINLSDSVVFIEGSGIRKGILLNFINQEAKVLVINSKENMEEFMIPVKKLFTIDNEEMEDLTGLEANQIIEFTSGGKNNESIVKEVIGLREDRVLMKISKNQTHTYSIVPVDKLKYKQ